MRKRKRAFIVVAELFREFAYCIEQENRTVEQTVKKLCESERFTDFAFLSNTLDCFYKGNDLEEAWKNAVENDYTVKLLGAELNRDLSELSHHFNDINSSALVKNCRRISEKAERAGKSEAEKSAVNEKLVLTGSVLCAAAVGIILF